MTKHYQVIIVGSGIAGLAAAERLAKHGLQVLLVDDNAQAGGQLLRRSLHTAGHKWPLDFIGLKRRGWHVMERLKRSSVQCINYCQVLGIFAEHTLLVESINGSISEYQADAIILATGAREKQFPFNGWTLPGVMATGAAQILLKNYGMLPGRKTLIGGNGPLMLALATEILANGGIVRALLDQTTFAKKIRAFAAGPATWPKLIEGAYYLSQVAVARVPFRQGVRIVEARGCRELESVVYARSDASGRIIKGTEKICSTDTLAVGYGFAPNIELPRQAGCSVSYDADKGGWITDVDESMAASVPGIYAVGEVTGIAGATKSYLEGQIAAWEILLKIGRVDRRRYEKRTHPLKRQRCQQVRYGRFINQLCRLNPDSYAEIPDETTICRCEEITMGEIRRQLSRGFTTMNGIKRATRCTMGNCQGRTCGPIISDIIGSLTRQPPAAIGCPSARAPIKPVSLGVLAETLAVTNSGPDDRIAT